MKFIIPIALLASITGAHAQGAWNSCHNWDFTGRVITAVCPTKNGKLLASQLRPNEFVTNRNGYLRVGFCHPIPSLRQNAYFCAGADTEHFPLLVRWRVGLPVHPLYGILLLS
jgi:hypothetical protein